IVTLGARHHDSSFNYLSSSNSSKHPWIGPVGNRVITVDINGGGQFQSVQDAVNAVPDNNIMNVLIQIRAGCYKYELIS
ncbi:putative pectinesterase 68-like, partial [Trifolium medium]|nr:putative pectinesterase 68-like [Trifolium medium]